MKNDKNELISCYNYVKFIVMGLTFEIFVKN